MLGAAPGRRRLLGELLRLRRAVIGYRYVPAFVKDRDINTRMVGDIEHGRRDTYTFPTLKDIAAAYKVTYESMMAVVWSDAGELVPEEQAPQEAPAAAPAGDPPFADPARAAGDRSYFDEINEQRFALAAAGILDPTGAQMFPDDADDARAWDGIGARLDIGARVWFIADLRRRAADRNGNSGTGVTGA